MIHCWLDTAAGFPPELHIHGGPLSGRTWPTLAACLHSLQLAQRGRETLRVWCRDLDALWFMAKDESIEPAFTVLPGLGVTGLEVCGRVQIRHARQVLSDVTLEQLANVGAPEGYAAVEESLNALETVLGVDASSGIGAATSAALWGGRWMPRWTAWPADAGEELRRLCQDAYHGGMSRALWQEGITTAQGAHPGAIWETERASVLPDGWALVDVDRDSAYAADACGVLPDTLSERVTDAGALLDCQGGAIVDAHVDLRGFTGTAFPVRVQITPEICRSLPMTAGRWRGVWSSDLLRWASEKGAHVEPLGGMGWKRGARFMGPLMSALWAGKRRFTGTARETMKAAIQRAVGRLGRRTYNTVTLVGDAARAEVAAPHEWPMKWTKVHGWTDSYFVADKMDQTGQAEPRGILPAWPPFVVSRAWIQADNQMHALASQGAWPMYVDTDGIMVAAPPGMSWQPETEAMGGWREKHRYSAAENRAPRQFVRTAEDGAEVTQFAGVPKSIQRDVLAGVLAKHETRTALLDLQAAFGQRADRLGPVLYATRNGVDRAKRIGKHQMERENR